MRHFLRRVLELVGLKAKKAEASSDTKKEQEQKNGGQGEKGITAETLSKQELTQKLWEGANRLRGKVKAIEYKDFFLGFLFYKFLSDAQEAWMQDTQDIDLTVSKEEDEGIYKSTRCYVENDPEVIESIIEQQGFCIRCENLFSSWVGRYENTKDTSSDTSSSPFEKITTQTIIKALEDFNRNVNVRYDHVYKNIFQTLKYGLQKSSENNSDSLTGRERAVRDILKLIITSEEDESGNAGELRLDNDKYDMIGYIYEYFIEKFSALTTKDDGAFYTPPEVSELMAKIVAERIKDNTAIKDNQEIGIYDPTLGSAGLLLKLGRSCEEYIPKEKIRYYGQEYNTETFNLSRMNLVMRGLTPDQIDLKNGDTLADDWPYGDVDPLTGVKQAVRLDAVVSNPPYSLRWEVGNVKDARFVGYGIAPRKAADYAFLLHCLYHLKPDGAMGIVLPHGVLTRGNTEKAIRQALIDKRNIETIIGLPANLFYSTNIPTIIMILRKNRTEDDVLFVDASQEFEKVKKQNRLTQGNIQRIFEAVVARKDIEKFAHLASKKEISDNDYNLNIPRYVNTFEKEPVIALEEIHAGLAEAKAQEKEALENLNKMMAELGLEGVLA